nr:uncharacterized protein LOC115858774 [Globicephala melas]
MRDHLFCHGNGDPLSEGSPLERAPSSFFPPAPKAGSNPYASAPALSTPIPGVADSPGTRGPQAKHSSTPARPSPVRQAQENVHSTPPPRRADTPRPLETPLTSTHRCQNAPIPTNGVFNPSREPPHLPFALGQSPPHLKRWSPSRGFHPESPTGVISTSQAASPPPPRSRRRRREPPQLLPLPPPPPHPDLLQTDQPPSPPTPQCRKTPARGWVLTGNKLELASPPPTPRQGSRRLQSFGSLREASDESGAPSRQAPSHRPNRPEAAASSQGPEPGRIPDGGREQIPGKRDRNFCGQVGDGDGSELEDLGELHPLSGGTGKDLFTKEGQEGSESRKDSGGMEVSERELKAERAGG